MERELHSESGDLNLATCLAGTGESSNMGWKVSAPGRGEGTLQKLSKVITQRNATAREIMMTPHNQDFCKQSYRVPHFP